MVQHVGDVVRFAGQTIERTTLDGLKTASTKSGVSFQYLVAKAAQESSLKTDAQAATSSAKGLFQFTKGTWLDMMKRFGDHYGYGELTKRISTDANGKASVDDPRVERRILDLRRDPETSALMAAEYARGNAASLEGVLGRGAEAPDLYLAHFLGPTGAGRLLSAAQDSPNSIAAELLPAAADANKSVFYKANGTARSAAEVLELIRGRFSNQMDRYADVAAALAAEDNVRAMTDGRASFTPGKDFNVMDFRTNLNGGNSYAMAVTWMVLEEMAKLITSSPMTMMDGLGEDEDGEAFYRQQSPGFHGQDFAAALAQSMSGGTQSPREPARSTAPDHQRSAAAYEARYTPIAAPRTEKGTERT